MTSMISRASLGLLFVLPTLAVGCVAPTEGAAADPSAVAADDDAGDAGVEFVMGAHGGGTEPGESGERSPDAVHGGTGGRDWLPVRCPTVVGMTIHAATYVDEITMDCEGPGARWPASPVGGTGGNWYPNQNCPDGYIVTGVFGRSHTYLDKIGFICRNTADMRQQWTSQAMGGGGGDSFTDDCYAPVAGQGDSPGGWKLIGFNVRAGNWIDAIAPVCGPM